MKTQTIPNREAAAAQAARPLFPRLLSLAAGMRKFHAIIWMLAWAPIFHGSVAFAQLTIAPEGNEKISGVGMVLSTRGNDFIVSELLPKSPADASKLIHKGDRILGIAEGEEPSQPFLGKELNEAVAMIRGRAGSNVRLMVLSEGAPASEIREVLLTRQPLNVGADSPPDEDAAKPEPAGPDAATPALVFERLPGGEADKLSNYRGKIVVLEFWATWCAPSQSAMAELQRTAAQSNVLRGKVEFITVSMDRGKEKPAAQLQEKGWTETRNGWAARAALAPWRIQGLPATYVIDADGQIVAGNPRMTQAMLEDLVKLLMKN
jgi:thiol-disulfide isomerase/thioredoxin